RCVVLDDFGIESDDAEPKLIHEMTGRGIWEKPRALNRTNEGGHGGLNLGFLGLKGSLALFGSEFLGREFNEALLGGGDLIADLLKALSRFRGNLGIRVGLDALEQFFLRAVIGCAD